MKANGIKLIAAMLVVLLPAIVVAQTFPELQKAEEETTIVEKKGGSVAMSPRFLSLDGNWYSLKEFFFEDRPVFLCMNYASCPQLCELQLKNLADQFHESKLVPGKDFEFISISLDPREARKKTREVKERFSRLMTGEADHKGIHFLIGKRDDIDQVAKSIGFFYSYVASVNHYSHAPVCVALSPDGRISRYIHGVGFTAEDLVESAETASDGKIAEKSVASFVYRCSTPFPYCTG